MPLLRALASLTVLVGVLVGVPWLLLTLADPTALLSLSWPEALLRPDDGTALLGLLSLVGWAAWLFLAATILAEAASVLTRGRIDVRIPGGGWARVLVAPLVAAALFAPSSAAAAPEPPPPTAASTPVAPEAGPVAPAESAAPSTGRTYECAPGDELWSVAESQLGSGDRWRDLLTVNPQLGADSRLAPGDVLQLPPDVQVREGDSLWALAERHLGDGHRWGEIHELNEDLIADPDVIDVGWRLLLPPDDASPTVVEPPSPTPVEPEPKSTPEPVPAPEPTAAPSIEAEPAPPSGTPAPATAAPTAPTPAPSEPPPATAVVVPDESDPRSVLGPIGGVLASAIVVSVAARRRLQLVGRAIGQRLVPLAPEATRFWTALARRAEDAEEPTEPGPTTVVLGWRDDGRDVVLDLEDARATSIVGAEDPQGVVAAMASTLLCAPWATEVEVLLVGADQPWSAAIDEPRLDQITSVTDAVDTITRRCAERRAELGTRLLDDVRADPELAPAWAPLVVLFAAQPSPAQARQLEDALGFGRVGVSVVAPELPFGTRVQFGAQTTSLDGVRFHPQLLERPARRAVVELFASTATIFTEAAPWWTAGRPRRSLDDAPDDIHDEEPTLGPTGHPSLRLFGEPELLDARGERPTRARQQCVEYATWLLTRGPATPTVMARSLCVAEGTRRSNLSRLRSWLGSDDEGNNYLPDGYRGRIGLDPRITSDWHQLQQLVGGSVDDAHTHALRDALTLVTAAPLGEAVHRWAWARPLHDDMVAFVVDVACELADRALHDRAYDEALAVLQHIDGILPDHDEIRIRTIRAHSLQGSAEATEESISSFLEGLRTDNREVGSEHTHELAEARRRL